MVNVPRRIDGRISARCAFAALVVFAGASCSSTVEPRSGVTVLVTNETCEAGACGSLEVLAFPGRQPNTPGGLWSIDLGTITTSQACFEIPPSSTFRIVGVNDNGATDTTTITWTNDESLALGTYPPPVSRLDAAPTTTAFVPANAAGWSVSLPSGSLTAQPSACSP